MIGCILLGHNISHNVNSISENANIGYNSKMQLYETMVIEGAILSGL